ncbi:MAG TPA: hypothetical protein VGT05_01370 [Patescibacteria group bacterium]|nr:hypothetical protein [Patescibacteria group bacterium]
MTAKRIFTALFLFAILLFLLHFLIVKKTVYGDGRYYFAYLPSILIHHTLDFSDSAKQLGIITFKTISDPHANKYSIGTTLFWVIPYVAVHLFLTPFKLNDGYNTVYQVIIGLTDVALVFAGLFVLYRTLQLFFSKKIALISCVVIFLATNLLFYGAIDVVNSHSVSFFTSCLFVYFWMGEKSKQNAIMQGFFLGLLALIRSQDVVFLLLPFSTLVITRQKYLMQFLLITATAVITFIPQFYLWQRMWGYWRMNPYSLEPFYFLKPHIFGVLFNLHDGLFLWTPITALSFIGLIMFARRNKTVGIPSILVFLTELYLVSSFVAWQQGESYSGRMFISSLPLLAIGFGYLLSIKTIQKSILLSSLFFSLLNPLLIVIYLLYVR